MERDAVFACPRCGGRGELTTVITRSDGRNRRYVCRQCHQPFRTHEGPILDGRCWVQDGYGEWHRARAQ